MKLTELSKDVKDVKRVKQILTVIAKQGMGDILDNMDLLRHVPVHHKVSGSKAKRKTRPLRVRLIMEDLGGAFVKLGQLLSLRPDLIPEKYCKELENLQDSVRPFGFKSAKAIIESELKKPISDIFSHFEEKPVASASIGQVHIATLKNKKRVAVKIQRPNIAELMHEDIDILYFLARLMEKRMEYEFIDPTEIVREFEKYTNNELDYMHEARNIEKFYNAFDKDPDIKIPKVYRELTTSRVLVMEYIDGFRVDDLAKIKRYSINRKLLAKKIAEMVFKQIFIHGIFHADPHPGNIFIINRKKIALLDFGIVGIIDNSLREKLTNIFIGFIQGDVDEIAQGFFEMGMVDDDFDMDILKEDIVDTLSEYYNVGLSKINVSKLVNRSINMAIKDKIHVPSNVVLLGKSLVTVEGFCQKIDPSFNIVQVARPFVRQLIKEKTSPKYIFRKLSRKSIKLGEFVTKMPEISSSFLMRLTKADTTLNSIDQDLKDINSQIRMSVQYAVYGVIIAVLLLSSAMMMRYDNNLIFGVPAYSFLAFIFALLLFIFMITRKLR